MVIILSFIAEYLSTMAFPFHNAAYTIGITKKNERKSIGKRQEKTNAKQNPKCVK